MLQNKSINLILWITVLLGGMLCFLPGARIGFPVNDGGMLLAMIRDLQSNGFVLPAVTSYNFLDIPFAYPPFGLYVAALLSRGLSIPELELLRWLPPLVSTAILPAFYWLAYRILDSKSKAVIATIFYAFTPGSSDWFIMGGGLTRSFGILFSLLAIGHVYCIFCGDTSRTRVGLAALFCALAVLSHPEVGLQTAGICFLFWLFYGRNAAGINYAILVALGTALLTVPWWLTVLSYHGFSPFVSAMHTGIREATLASIYHTFFSTQGGFPILPLLWLIGMFAVLRKQKFLLFAWAFLPFAVDPRNAPAIAIFPFLMLVSEGTCFLNNELTRAYLETFPTSKNSTRYLPFIMNGILAVILLFLFSISYRSVPNLVAVSLSSPDRETMEWAKENTPSESRFLLITNTGNISPMTDAYQEWFPALAERRSQNTLQGKEWLLGSDFFEYSQALMALQRCPDADCLKDWLEENSVPVDFVLVRKQRSSPDLRSSLQADPRYRLVHESENVEIFAVEP
ncbi:MAG TPA: hypothetical protein VHP14_03530 [Anaerolineales bacterium]|nr:hypothetical protein [Anaerolineales bacterium]